MQIKEAQDRVWQYAQDKGWAERKVEIPEQVALIHSEASEALEAWRNNEPISWVDEKGKPQGVGSEYADIIIRVLHYASVLDLNMEEELKLKMNYNDTRAYKHGGKIG